MIKLDEDISNSDSDNEIQEPPTELQDLSVPQKQSHKKPSGTIELEQIETENKNSSVGISLAPQPYSDEDRE